MKILQLYCLPPAVVPLNCTTCIALDSHFFGFLYHFTVDSLLYLILNPLKLFLLLLFFHLLIELVVPLHSTFLAPTMLDIFTRELPNHALYTIKGSVDQSGLLVAILETNEARQVELVVHGCVILSKTSFFNGIDLEKASLLGESVRHSLEIIEQLLVLPHLRIVEEHNDWLLLPLDDLLEV